MSRFTAFPGKYGFLLSLVFAFLFAIVSISLGTIGTSASNTNQALGFLTGDEQFTFVVNKIASSSDEDADVKNSPVFADFDNWVKQYKSQNLNNSSQADELGKELAIKRRQILKELMQKDPQAALEKAISPETLGSLPSFVAEYAEKPISARGDFLVFETDETDASGKQMNGSHLEYKVVVGKSVYKAFVYGRRAAMTSKLNIPLRGIILDDTMAIDEQPLRKLDSLEYESNHVDSTKVGENGVAAEVGGELRYFSNQTEFNNFVGRQIEWESKIGPAQAPENLSLQEPASSWTEGAKTVLVIRVDFPDKTGDPVDYYNQTFTQAVAQSMFVDEISPFYVNNSYGKTSLAPTVTSVVRMPQPQTFYTQGGNYYNLLTDARAAALNAGFDTNNFDLDVVAFSYTSGFGFAGISGVGYKGSLINGAFSLPVIAHELGHQFGLLHANLWRTTDGTIIGQGSNMEAADCFDTMSYCIADINSHFNARYKNILNWIADANVQTVTTSGTYRIFAQDAPAPGGIRTLKIKKDDTKNYWVEFRQLFAGNARNGALLHWDYSSQNFQETQLLDMNPATSTVGDAPLLIGQSFYDSASQIKITVVGKGGTTPESLDVRVELNSGTTPTPTPTSTPTPTPNCTYSITPASQNFSASGGTGSISVTAPSGCSWTSAANQNFVSITSGNAGNGSGTINYSVAANTGAARSGTIAVAGQTFTAQQSGATTGSYTLVATPAVAAPGGQLTVNFTAPNGSATLDWIGLYKVGAANTDYLDGGYTNGLTAGVLHGNAPSQAGQYEFRYLLNNSYTSVATSNTITVQTATPTPTPTVTPTPTPVPTCNYSITSSNQSFSAAGGGGTVNVTTASGCNWTVTGNSSWITIAGGNSGSGTGTISFTVQPNTASARTGTITVAGQIYTVTQAASIVSNSHTRFDFDGDGRADLGVFRPSTGIWYLNQSSNGFGGMQFGISIDKIVPADFDGDGRTDVAVYRAGTWYIQRSQLGFTAIAFGAADDIPVPADFDGDGKAEVAVFRPSNGVWYIYNLTTNQFTAYQFGQMGDIPVVGDYDGDGRADQAVFRNGMWYLNESTAGFTGIQFGQSTDKPVPADFDGDGKTDIAVFRPNNGTWYLQRSQLGFTGIQFGQSTDKPVPADYDGDGKADIAVFRNGTWYLQQSTNGFAGIAFGTTNDSPLAGAFVR